MNIILREKFVELYEAPILENVSIPPLYPCQNLVVFLQTNILTFLPWSRSLLNMLLPVDCFVTFYLFLLLQLNTICQSNHIYRDWKMSYNTTKNTVILVNCYNFLCY